MNSPVRGIIHCALLLFGCAASAAAQVSKDLIFASRTDTVSAADGDTSAQGGLDCLPVCDICHLGGPFEQSCFPEWSDDGECDCGCQFSDTADCGGSCTCPAACDWCWCNTTAQNNCPPSWYGDGECDCGCSPADSDCGGTATTGACCLPDDDCTIVTAAACANAVGAYRGNNTTCPQASCSTRCAAICDYCWTGSPIQNQCPLSWQGDGVCDCGCQWTDPDCGPKGACCAPANGLCLPLTEITCEVYAAGFFGGVGVACDQVECDRCDAGCDWCWMDTIGEHACLPEWAQDIDCDCGCQFSDPACAANVCGNLICTETATACPDDCKDLRAFASFQNCFKPGSPTAPECAPHAYATPAGIDLKDFRAFVSFLVGP